MEQCISSQCAAQDSYYTFKLQCPASLSLLIACPLLRSRLSEKRVAKW